MNTYYTFIDIVKRCFNLNTASMADVLDASRIIQHIWEESDNPKKLEDYLSIPPFGREGHARIRQMMIYMSEYMDKHNIEKGETFNRLYTQLVEMFRPDGRSNVEEYYKAHDTTKYENLVIRNIESALVGVGTNIREAFRLSNELGTKNDEYTMEKLKEKIQQRLDYIYNKNLEEKVYGK